MNNIIEFYIDEYVKYMLLIYFYPLYQLGQQDEWMKLGITLNGAKSIC